MPPQANTSQALLALVSQQSIVHESLTKLGQVRETLVLGPCHAAAHAYLLTALCRLHPKKSIWILHDLPRQRERITAEMECWGQSALTLPEPAADLVDGSIADPEAEAERLQVFESLSQSQRVVIHTHASALQAAAPSPHSLVQSRLVLQKNKQLDPQKFTSSLAEIGYERSAIVHARGQFAVRGGIIDVMPWHAAMPLRIEFFDQEIESIREYDPDSQLSTGKRDRVTLSLREPDKSACARDYIAAEHLVIHVGDEIDVTLFTHLQLCEHSLAWGARWQKCCRRNRCNLASALLQQ